jgi:hypothetical protein
VRRVDRTMRLLYRPSDFVVLVGGGGGINLGESDDRDEEDYCSECGESETNSLIRLSSAKTKVGRRLITLLSSSPTTRGNDESSIIKNLVNNKMRKAAAVDVDVEQCGWFWAGVREVIIIRLSWKWKK